MSRIPSTYHQLDRASGGDGDVWGGVLEDSVSNSSSDPDFDFDSSPNKVIWMEFVASLVKLESANNNGLGMGLPKSGGSLRL